MLRLSNNTDLPSQQAFKVKSTWLLIVTVLVTLCNAVGFDLMGSLCDAGLGCTAEAVVATGERTVNLIQQLIPIGTSIWLWLERRAPGLRLVFWKS